MRDPEVSELLLEVTRATLSSAEPEIEPMKMLMLSIASKLEETAKQRDELSLELRLLGRKNPTLSGLLETFRLLADQSGLTWTLHREHEFIVTLEVFHGSQAGPVGFWERHAYDNEVKALEEVFKEAITDWPSRLA